MPKASEDNGLADLIISGGLGYLLGKGKYADWFKDQNNEDKIKELDDIFTMITSKI